MESKKISFGFMKTKKAEKATVEDKKEFIEYVEEKSIKVVRDFGIPEIIQDNAPLVIPMKPNTLITAERLQQIAEKVESALNDPEPEKTVKPVYEKLPENETIDQMAVRELIEDAKKEIKVETTHLTVALSSKPVIGGEKESNLDDYEAIPIKQFGLAMLRGMGWTQDKEESKYKQPQLRPKGLGLGADKAIKENQKKKKGAKNNKDAEELSIVKNSFVKITMGKFSGCYGKVLSLDEDNSRVVLDIPIKKDIVSLSEFMMFPVTKAEFDKESKVINADTFEEYKKGEQKLQKSTKNYEKGGPSKSIESNVSQDVKKEDRIQKNDEKTNGRSRNKERHRQSSSSEEMSNHRQEKKKKQYSSSESLNSLSDYGKKHRKERKHRRHGHSSSSQERSRHRQEKGKKKYSSSESLNSISDHERKPNKEKKHKNKDKKGRDSSSESFKKRESTSKGKRDIDKKRKGKKKKRDRDRSPNYKKYRK